MQYIQYNTHTGIAVLYVSERSEELQVIGSTFRYVTFPFSRLSAASEFLSPCLARVSL